jgi:hypothetical protein
MTRWTPAQVAGLAPDDASLVAARRLARPGPWSDTGSTETLVWGKCQGSGRTPYQVSVDLAGPAFRCSCPSRKHPCKHGLALLLLWVDGSGSVADVEEAAGFAREWAAERAARGAARDAATEARAGRTPDPDAQARRLEDRLALMTAGMDDFARWLGDLVRGGTATARRQPQAWWETTAARLVDAQLPGVADDVRSVGSEVAWRADWSERLLVALGRWWTATRTWSRRDSLDPDELGDLRAYLGWSVPTDTVRAGDALHDRWTVLGAHRTDDGRLQQQRTWLRGEASGHTVVVLDFAAGTQVLPVARLAGSVLDATVARYPGRGVRRALFVDDPAPVATDGPLPGTVDVEGAYALAARVWAANPWTRRVPVALAAVRVGVDPPRSPVSAPAPASTPASTPASGPASALLTARAVDAGGRGIDLTADAAVWALLARTGGHPADVFGELEHGRFRPLTLVQRGEVVAL